MYDKVKIIIEKDGEEIVKGEVLRREEEALTAYYLTQNFWTLHTAAIEILKGRNLPEDEDE